MTIGNGRVPAGGATIRGERDDLPLSFRVRTRLAGGGGSQVRTRLGGRVRLRPLRILRVYKKGGAATKRCPATFLL